MTRLAIKGKSYIAPAIDTFAVYLPAPIAGTPLQPGGTNESGKSGGELTAKEEPWGNLWDDTSVEMWDDVYDLPDDQEE